MGRRSRRQVRARTSHLDVMRGPDPAVVIVDEFPTSEWLGYAIAVAANDHDVAGGAMLTGPELDAVEEMVDAIGRKIDRRVLGL